ncbi:unnamed protein product [Linum trigynum]|uniref:Uncharacterized protein n=1 Tax=Linum trigynum TaxID=586398 RepID=A0AAV2F6Y7_9ROSI
MQRELHWIPRPIFQLDSGLEHSVRQVGRLNDDHASPFHEQSPQAETLERSEEATSSSLRDDSMMEHEVPHGEALTQDGGSSESH